MKKGDKVKCFNADPLDDNDVGPPLTEGIEYTIKNVILDSKGNPHIDVGLKSEFNYISSYETLEHLPDGDTIHWCHPSRFRLRKRQS